MNTIKGKQIAEQIIDDVCQQLSTSAYTPQLDIILANDDPSSHTYVRLKRIQAEKIGIKVVIHEFSQNTSAQELESLIDLLNNDKECNGILVQLPLHNAILSPIEVINRISPEKDVDGLTAINQGRYAHGLDGAVPPATVAAIIECISATLVDDDLNNYLVGKNVVIINNSLLIGKPLATYLAKFNATVTLANKHTKNLAHITKEADILISATGNPGLIKEDMIKEGVTIIDVSSIKTEDGIKGDVDLSKNLGDKVGWITPVPGGVGPVTIACLIRNLLSLSN